MIRIISMGVLIVLAACSVAFAHASEQGFVLLLLTDIYIMTGVATVVLTVVLLALLPGSLFASG